MGKPLGFLLKLAVIVAASTSSAAFAGESRVKIVEAALVQLNTPPEIVEPEWENTASVQNVVDEWRPDLQAMAYAILSCGMSELGSLFDCEISESGPEDGSMNDFFLSLARHYQASSIFVDRYGHRVSRIILSISVLNPAGRKLDRNPCYPPFCVSHHGPPPPPPPGERG